MTCDDAEEEDDNEDENHGEGPGITCGTTPTPLLILRMLLVWEGISHRFTK
jgi:hypothetical protein